MSGKQGIDQGSRTYRFIIGSLDIGGTEKHLSLILPRLKQTSFVPVVITLTHRGALADGLEKQGIRVLGPPSWVRCIQRIPLLSRILSPLATIFYLRNVYQRNPAALTCFYLPGAYYLGSIAAWITGEERRTVMFRRSLNEYQQARPIISRIERILHKWPLLIVGNSRAVLEELSEKEGIPRDRLRLIYNGIETVRYGDQRHRVALRRELGLDMDATVLCMVANLIPYKGHADLIEALAGVTRRTNHAWTLLCVGSGLESRRLALENLVRAKGLGENVMWLGRREDIPEILSTSDIGLVVSHQEGFSNAVLEGMAAGLPMIVTDVGGNAEAVEHEKNGLVVKPHDPSGLGEAILRLMNDPQEARRYGTAGRERVQARFSIEKCVSEYQALFKQIPTLMPVDRKH